MAQLFRSKPLETEPTYSWSHAAGCFPLSAGDGQLGWRKQGCMAVPLPLILVRNVRKDIFLPLWFHAHSNLKGEGGDSCRQQLSEQDGLAFSG